MIHKGSSLRLDSIVPPYRYKRCVAHHNLSPPHNDHNLCISHHKQTTNHFFSQQGAYTHIDIRYFFIKDRIDNGDIKVEYLHTKSMIADYLTKPLVGELFYKLRDLLLGYTTL